MAQPKLDAWYRKARQIRHIGQNLSYCDNNADGEAILLLHGFPNSSWDWYQLWPLLGQKYRLIAPDFLGYGRSDKPLDYDYSVHDQVDQVINLLAHLRVRRIHLMTHSSGAAVCQELVSMIALDHEPDMPEVLSLCFLNGGISPGEAPTIMEQRMVKSLGPNAASVVDEVFVRNAMNSLAGALTPLAQDEAGIYFEQLRTGKGLQVVSRLLDYMEVRVEMHNRWMHAMRQTDIPLSAIIGAADPIWGLGMKPILDASLPYLRVDFIEKAGHYPMLQAPGQVARLWLSGRARQQTAKSAESLPGESEVLYIANEA